jgi:hypothetical protein
MNRLNTARFVMSVLLTGSAIGATVPAQAQPMMGEMGMHHDEGRAHDRMTRHWGKNQINLKAKLRLATTQEPAWAAFVQGMKIPAQRLVHPVDQEALAKLSTPERIETMNAMHETNLATMQKHIKQRTEATRTFYDQLSVEQQKVFDAETLPEHSRWKGKTH